MKYSMLDLASVPDNQTFGEAIAGSVALAQACEDEGYTRYWLAEHHNMPGIASSATSLLIGHIAQQTRTMRIGAGGVMLPNHAPLVIAEQFGTLASIYPGRIDLGLGRAPGTDMLTARALRRHMDANDNFPSDVGELLTLMGEPVEGQKVHAFPGEQTHVPVWILGSSLYGAQLAAQAGLPYAFASHFAPDMLDQAAEVYRRYFRPSEFLEAPHFMLAMQVCAAETDEEAQYLRSSLLQGFANLRTNNPGRLPAPVENIEAVVDPQILRMVEHTFRVSAVGSKDTVREQIGRVVETYKPDELMITGQVYHSAPRIASARLAAQAMRELGMEPAQGAPSQMETA